MAEQEDELMTLAEAAAYAGVPLRTIQYAAKRKNLKTVVKYGRILTTQTAVDAWKKNPKKHVPQRKPR